MTENLKQKTFYGVIWSYVNKFFSLLMGIVPAMILTRLLPPSEYGLIAMAAIFTNVAYQLADGGFGNALVQKKEADHLDFCSVFFFNLFLSILMYGVFFFLAPFCADFFHEERLVSIIRVSTLGLVFLAFGQVQGIIFKKNLDFKRSTIRNLISQVVAVFVAIVMAFSGYGIWALVVQGILQTFVGSFLNWFFSDWRPTFCFSFHRLNLLFNFGSKSLLSSLIDYGFNKAYDIIIGRRFSPASLALYNRAYTTSGLFKDTFFNVFSGVTFPVFVQMQDDNDRLKSNIRKFLMIVSMMIFTVMLCLYALSEPLFRFLYSAKWDDAIPLFKIACLASLLTPLVSILESVILAKGQSGKFLFISVIRKVFVVLVIGVTWNKGIAWMMYGQILVSVCEIIIYSFFVNRMVAYSLYLMLRDLLPSLLLAVSVSLIVYFCDMRISHFLSVYFIDVFALSVARLVLGCVMAVLVFFLVCKLLKIRAYRDLLDFLAASVGENRIIKVLR